MTVKIIMTWKNKKENRKRKKKRKKKKEKKKKKKTSLFGKLKTSLCKG